MKKNGFTLVELIIAIGLAALFIPALVNVFSFSLRSADQGRNYSQAYAVAQEQMEAIYYLKEFDPEWLWLPDSPANNSPADHYQLELVGGEWQRGGKTSTLKEMDGYTSKVKILPVHRDSLGDIQDDPVYPLDPTSRKIIVTVSWKENGVPTEVELVSYVSRH